MGRPVHFEIHAGDPERAVAFYSTVFGWQANRWGEVPYWLLGTGEGQPGVDGALVVREGRAPGPDDPVNGATLFVSVDDVDATSAAVLASGGQQVTDKAAVPGIGWIAYYRDSEGNLLGALQEDPQAA
jgi:uncharacterized protein